jgi:hypothetical protein
VFNFNGGTLTTKGTVISNAQPFLVGNGVSAATLAVTNLTGGGLGAHYFQAGLVITNNAILRGNGIINGAVQVKDGGQIAPGFSTGTLTFAGGLTLASGATNVMELVADANGGNGGNDQLVIGSGSSLTLGGSVLSLMVDTSLSAGVLTNGTQFLLIDNQDAAAAITGTFAGFGQMTTNEIGGVKFEFNYTGGTGNDLVLTVVPEPSAFLLVGLGLAGMLVLRRRANRTPFRS